MQKEGRAEDNQMLGSMTIDSSVEFTFTGYTFSLVPKLILVNCSSFLIVQLAMVKSCTCSRVDVSSIIISLTSGWKKVLGKCHLTMSGGILILQLIHLPF